MLESADSEIQAERTYIRRGSDRAVAELESILLDFMFSLPICSAKDKYALYICGFEQSKIIFAKFTYKYNFICFRSSMLI